MANLKIYVRDNCLESAQAFELASRLKMRLPQLKLELIKLTPDEIKNKNLDKYQGPIFVLNDSIVHMGLPDEEIMVKAFLAFDREHQN